MRSEQKIEVIRVELNNLEQLAKERQKCLRKSVGASIVQPTPTGLLYWGAGVNGPSAGSPCSNEIGNCGCCHAEPLAIMVACHRGIAQGPRKENVIMVCSYSPCTNCANMIVGCEFIGMVIFRTLTEHDRRGVHILLDAKILALGEANITEDDLDHFETWN